MTTTVRYGWRCLMCPERGEGRGFNAQAERHVAETKHVTTTWGRPA